MKKLHSIWWFLPLVFTVSSPPINAQTQIPNITGKWAFKTEPFFMDMCTITGVFSIQATQTTKYECRFQAMQKCGSISGHTTQTCLGEYHDGKLKIDSTVVSYKSEQAPDALYVADSFILDEILPHEMRGILRSVDEIRVEFTKVVDSIS